MFEKDKLSKNILARKYELIKEGKHPRILLVNDEEYNSLKSFWIQSIEDLPYGHTLVRNLEASDSPHLIEGTIHGLWIIKVDIDSFKVY